MAERRPPGFNVDLGFYDSDEVLSIPRKIRAAAIGVWTLCGSYSANKLTDGYVSAEALRDRGCTPAIRAALIASTLWESAGGDAIRFTRWAKWQRTCAEVKTFREADAERKRRSRKRYVDATRPPGEGRVDSDVASTHQSCDSLSNASTSDNSEMSARTPDGSSQPVRADSGTPKTKTKTETKEKNSVVTLVGGSGGKEPNGSRLPNGWRPANPVVAQMRSDHPHINLETEHAKFVDYWQSKAGKDARKTDWDATWRNWIRRAAEQTHNRNGRHLSTADQRVAAIQALKTQPQRLEIE